ncbi:hypothetical protein PI126_g17938 [Phytophthora idaei]|nr:hypothetical protein PI126_g17938 [Phytophthora idaei]
MAFLLENDDQIFEAALSFVDEFKLDGTEADGPSDFAGVLAVDTGTLAPPKTSTVERQRKVATSLASLTKKRSTQLTNEYASLMSLCCSQSNTVDVLDFCGDIGDFRALFKRVDDAYRDVDAVFQSHGLARSTTSPGDVHMREGVEGVEKHLGVGSIYSKTAKNLDEPYTIIEDFSIEIYSNSSRADYKTKQVIRIAPAMLERGRSRSSECNWRSSNSTFSLCSARKQKSRGARREAQQPTDVLASAPQIPSLWQKLADRQRQRHEEAEETNVRLKLALEHHQKLTNALSSFLQMRANKLADDYSSFTDLRFVKHHGIDKHLGYGNLYNKAAKDLDEPFTVVEDLTKELANNNWHSLGDLVRRRALKVTKECTALTEQSCLTHHVVNVLHAAKDLDEPYTIIENFTKELHSDSSRADIKVKQVEEDAVFEAALSFLDEFATDTAIAEDSLGASSQGASLPTLDDAQGSSNRRPQEAQGGRRQRQPLTEEEKKRRKTEFNERRRLLRKTGVYGNANRARNERAREIAYQREQMERLQIDLQILQTRHAGKPCSQEKASVLAKTNSESKITSMWQELAAQQRRRREEAERDNVLLRLAVERQRKVANTLQSQMKRRATQLTNECASLITTARSRQHSFNVVDFRGDMESFRGLFRRLDDAYQTMDAVFMENGLAEATWKHFKGVEKHLANGSLYEKAEKGLDEPYTIIADFKKELYANSSRADIKTNNQLEFISFVFVTTRQFLQEDDDAFVAALSFLDEFAPGLTPHEGVVTPLFSALCGSSESLEDSTDSAATYTTKPKSKRTRRVAKKQETEEEKMRRKAERNEKRKLLRKAGVYGDANRARNERSREIAYLRDQMEKLQLDLRVLQTQRAKEKSEKKKQKKESETALVRKKSTQIITMWQDEGGGQSTRFDAEESDSIDE